MELREQKIFRWGRARKDEKFLELKEKKKEVKGMETNRNIEKPIWRSAARLKICCFLHKTPLLRQLKDGDIWMQYNKIINLKIAAKKINGIIIHPLLLFVELWIGRKMVRVNGTEQSIDVAPYLSDTGRTMIPLRFAAESLGAGVAWDNNTKTATIEFLQSPDLTAPSGGEWHGVWITDYGHIDMYAQFL